jgi:hypothetical protein
VLPLCSSVVLLLLLSCGGKPASDDDDDAVPSGTHTGDAGADSGGDPDDTAAPVDDVVPTIAHTPVSSPQPAGTDVALEARVTDSGSGVQRVWIEYRPEADTGWSSSSMTGVEDEYTGRIPGVALVGAGVSYYLVAEDVAGNTTFMTINGEAAAFWFAVVAE